MRTRGKRQRNSTASTRLSTTASSRGHDTRAIQDLDTAFKPTSSQSQIQDFVHSYGSAVLCCAVLEVVDSG